MGSPFGTTRRSGACMGSLAILTVAAAMAYAGPGRAASSESPQARAQRIATDAYVYGIAPLAFLRQARTQTSVTVPNDLSDAPINQLGSARQLANAQHQVFVQPNLDTLYSMAHLDLGRDAMVLHVPRVAGHRYYSFEFLDPYTNVFHYVGTRTTGNGAGTFVITGPAFRGRVPRRLRRIRSPYRLAWLAARTAVNGPADLASAHRVQDGYRLLPLREYLVHGLNWRRPRPRRVITRHTNFVLPGGLAFFDLLGDALAASPPPARDAAILRELRTVGIGPGLHPSQEHLSPQVVEGLKAAVQAGPGAVYGLRISIAAHSIGLHHGWFVPPSDTGYFGTDYRYRAVVALYGLAANRPKEAIYIVGAVDDHGSLLNGAHTFVVHFPAGQLPPARFFWSLTMYDQNFYLVPNSAKRYSLGSDTPTLKRNPDGSLDIYVQPSAPRGHESNWLPSPSSGTFLMTLRLYGPRQRALDDQYVYPPIARTG